MKISKIRVGYATNSSSTHSVFIYKGKPLHEDTDYVESDFGWEPFVLATRKAKAEYMYHQIVSAYDKVVGREAAKLIASSVTGFPGSKFDFVIDHQSLMYFPHNIRDPGRIDFDFVKDLFAFMMREDVIVVGGNDNEVHEVVPDALERDKLKEVEPVKVLFDYCFSMPDIVCRRDGEKAWTFFSRKNGNKLQFSFDDKEVVPSTPELVDLKITDYCDFGCKFCYENSTTKGKHAEYDVVSQILYRLSRLQVFEVALGGGDPLSHPDIINIVKGARLNGIVPNLSTKRIDWMDDAKLFMALAENVGAIGISISSIEEMEALLAAKKRVHDNEMYPREQRMRLLRNIKVHLIPEIMDPDVFGTIIDLAAENFVSLLFLGFKEVGRGVHMKSKRSDEWVRVFKSKLEDVYIGDIGIDTKLASDYKELLDELGVDGVFYYTTEGTHSMFIDAVRLVAGPCSYCPEEEMVKIAEYKVEKKRYYTYKKFVWEGKEVTHHLHERINELFKEFQQR